MLAFSRRLLVFIAMAVWWGGLTFYGAVVIHTAAAVLGGHSEVGFITQRVTGWLNWIGVVTLMLLAWNVVAARNTSPQWLFGLLVATLLIMAGIEVGLFAWHPQLDQLLNAVDHSIRDEEQFNVLHRLYLNATTIQWSAGLLHIACLSLAWRNETNLSGEVRQLSRSLMGPDLPPE